ncbi:MAG TPA: hypothetical protein VNO75_01720 [Gemmatimonadaceae bacterium]|nr:hypothetical protein [Gemmatimonadaceae bacterium]
MVAENGSSRLARAVGYETVPVSLSLAESSGEMVHSDEIAPRVSLPDPAIRHADRTISTRLAAIDAAFARPAFVLSSLATMALPAASPSPPVVSTTVATNISASV